ncbi:ABC transporter ATP-binding protein [Bacillus sp. 1P10SD]|uniref:ABC transporter ATP-binding protein n=1 Tax=Bacillus sp. 1P10SD TaxID=3132265 RepID=UPI0039A73E6A
MIHLQQINKTYKQGAMEVDVLKNINLIINKGEFVSIMGPSGSGKSTLMNIIGCLDRPSDGVYMLNDINILQVQDTDMAYIRNKHIGFVFQNFHLLPRLSAQENVELPLLYQGVQKKERRLRALEALKKVGLSDRMGHLPNQLSGGQKQRVAIARAIASNPTFILADEPTGSLDSISSQQIMEIFSALNKEGTTIIIITHELEVAAYTTRNLLVKDGRLLSEQKVLK